MPANYKHIKAFDSTDQAEQDLITSTKVDGKRALDTNLQDTNFYELLSYQRRILQELREMNLYLQTIVGEKLDVNAD